MTDKDLEQYRRKFKQDQYVILRKAMHPEVCVFMNDMLHMRMRKGTNDDNQVKGCILAVYAHDGGEVFLERFESVVEKITGYPVYPTNSYTRVYSKGNELVPHTDRDACEITVSLALDRHDKESQWPLELTDIHGNDIAIDMEPGDAVLYHGTELKHWRSPCPMNWYAQTFLHYVYADGEFANHKYDKRPGIGLNRTCTNCG